METMKMGEEESKVERRKSKVEHIILDGLEAHVLIAASNAHYCAWEHITRVGMFGNVLLFAFWISHVACRMSKEAISIGFYFKAIVVDHRPLIDPSVHKNLGLPIPQA
jgi:hypothetical protein